MALVREKYELSIDAKVSVGILEAMLCAAGMTVQEMQVGMMKKVVDAIGCLLLEKSR